MKQMRQPPLLILLLVLNGTSCDRATPAADESAARRTQTRSASTTVSTEPVAPVSSTSVAPATAPATTQATRQQQSQHDRLYGTWVAHDVDSKLGDVKIRLTFKQEGPVKILAWSELPFVGQVRNKQGSYEVHGNTISSEAIRGGTSVKYRFDGGELIIEYQDGKTVRFKPA